MVDEELAKKGLTKTDRSDAQLFLTYQASVGQKREFAFFNDWGFSPKWSEKWYGGRGIVLGTGHPSTIQIGALDLDIYDVMTKTLVWRGIASKAMDLNSPRERRQQNLRKAIKKLLRDYPPYEAAVLDG
jgi:hypothetical protein